MRAVRKIPIGTNTNAPILAIVSDTPRMVCICSAVSSCDCLAIARDISASITGDHTPLFRI